ncbi:cytidylyltransferase domain-containing protein [Robertmurraya sp. GLU-23]
MNAIVIIQARIGSTRLPGKVLKKLGEFDVLSYVVRRCKEINHIRDIIVATSRLSQDDVVEEWCQLNGVDCFRGSEQDVLDRYVQCAKQYEPSYVMRVTADCPFVDYEVATEILSLMEKKKVDIIDLRNKMPNGLAVELISYQALLYIHKHGKEQRHREHVTYYAYEHPEEFLWATYEVPINRHYPELRITLDTEEDYSLCLAIANHFNNPLVSSDAVINFLLDHPEVVKLNKHIMQKPVI